MPSYCEYNIIHVLSVINMFKLTVYDRNLNNAKRTAVNVVTNLFELV